MNIRHSKSTHTVNFQACLLNIGMIVRKTWAMNALNTNKEERIQLYTERFSFNSIKRPDSLRDTVIINEDYRGTDCIEFKKDEWMRQQSINNHIFSYEYTISNNTATNSLTFSQMSVFTPTIEIHQSPSYICIRTMWMVTDLLCWTFLLACQGSILYGGNFLLTKNDRKPIKK